MHRYLYALNNIQILYIYIYIDVHERSPRYANHPLSVEKTTAPYKCTHTKSPKISLSRRLFPTGLSVCTRSRFSITRSRECPPVPRAMYRQVNYIDVLHIYIYLRIVYRHVYRVQHIIVHYVYTLRRTSLR